MPKERQSCKGEKRMKRDFTCSIANNVAVKDILKDWVFWLGILIIVAISLVLFLQYPDGIRATDPYWVFMLIIGAGTSIVIIGLYHASAKVNHTGLFHK
jgi:hypothetical protein